MGLDEFYQTLRRADIASVKYPTAGANILLPYGKKLADAVENAATSLLEEESYVAVDFPNIVPESFIAHLRTDELFKAGNNFHSFYLSQGTEAQAAHTAGLLLRSSHDLPLRIYSAGRAYRQNSRTSLIKDLELRLFECHSFFSSPEEVQEEKERLSERFQRFLAQLHIPSVLVHESEDRSSQSMVYSHFPFSQSFGRTFTANALGTQFSSHIPNSYRKSNGTPHHCNAGFTSRVFAAYLANHMDEQGLRLDDIMPYQTLLNTASFDPQRLAQVRDDLRAAQIQFMTCSIANHAEAVSKFCATGIPTYVAAGRDELKVRIRGERDRRWVDQCALISTLKEALRAPQEHHTEVRYEDISAPLREYEPGIVYLVPPELRKSIALKPLGFIGEKYAMTKRKY